MSDAAIHWEARRKSRKNNQAFALQGAPDHLATTYGRIVATEGFEVAGSLDELLEEVSEPETLLDIKYIINSLGVTTVEDLDKVVVNELVHAGLKPAVARRLKASRLKQFAAPRVHLQNTYHGLDGERLPPINAAKLPTSMPPSLSVYGAADALATQEVTGLPANNTDRQDFWTMGRADKMLMREHMYGWGGMEKPKNLKDFRRLRQRHIANWRPPFVDSTAFGTAV